MIIDKQKCNLNKNILLNLIIFLFFLIFFCNIPEKVYAYIYRIEIVYCHTD